MKTQVIVLVVVSLLAFCQVSQAADLQAGWYAQLRSVNVYVYGDMGLRLYGGATFDTTLGPYGPFNVTDDPYGNNYSRTVQVPTLATGVTSGTGVELPLLMAGLPNDYRIAYLGVDWHTDYDSSQMRLQLVQNGQVLWEQNQSGDTWHYREMAYGVLAGGLVFRVVAVPEPTSLIALLVPLLGTGVALRRRCQR